MRQNDKLLAELLTQHEQSLYYNKINSSLDNCNIKMYKRIIRIYVHNILSGLVAC